MSVVVDRGEARASVRILTAALAVFVAEHLAAGALGPFLLHCLGILVARLVNRR